MILKICIVLLAYFIGSIPTAAWYAKYFFNINIKEHGSGNSGATNSMRVMGKKAGIVVLIIDILKGFLPVYFTEKYFENPHLALIVGIVVVFGHVFSCFINFKGGKGVASALGVIIAVYPVGAVICIPVFVAIVYLSKYVSLASLLAALVFDVIITFRNLDDPWFVLTSWLLFFLLVYTHRENIKKISNRTENTFPSKK